MKKTRPWGDLINDACEFPERCFNKCFKSKKSDGNMLGGQKQPEEPFSPLINVAQTVERPTNDAQRSSDSENEQTPTDNGQPQNENPQKKTLNS